MLDSSSCVLFFFLLYLTEPGLWYGTWDLRYSLRHVGSSGVAFGTFSFGTWDLSRCGMQGLYLQHVNSKLWPVNLS